MLEFGCLRSGWCAETWVRSVGLVLKTDRLKILLLWYMPDMKVLIKWYTLDLLFFCVVCFFYSIWKLYLCHTAGEETSVFNKIDAVLLVVSCGSEALWMFANAKWATWSLSRYVLWQTGCKHHIWAKLALPCWPVNEYIAAIKKKNQSTVCLPIFIDRRTLYSLRDRL